MSIKRKEFLIPLLIMIAAVVAFALLFFLCIHPVQIRADELEELADNYTAEAVAEREEENLSLMVPSPAPDSYTAYVITYLGESGNFIYEEEFNTDGKLLRHETSDKIEVYYYDDAGNTLRYDEYNIESDGSTPELYESTVNAYNGDNKHTASYSLGSFDENGGLTVDETMLYSYDDHGNLCSITKTNINGPVFVQVITNSYDEDGRLIKTVTREDDADGGYMNVTETYKYDERGNIIQETSSTTDKGWDGTSSFNDKQVREYDEQDRVVVQYYYYNGRLEDTTHYTYWDNGNLKSRIIYESGEDTPRQTTNYDENGKKIEEDINAEEEYDSLGRIVRSVSTEGSGSKETITTKEYEYGENGLLEKVTIVKDDQRLDTVSTRYEKYSYIY